MIFQDQDDMIVESNFVEKVSTWKKSTTNMETIHSPLYLCPHPTATTSPLAPSQVNDNNNHRRWPTAARCLPEHQANEWVGLTCLILTSVGNLLSCELLRQAGHLRFEM